VPGHEDIAGKESVDQLARTRHEYQFIGPETACTISVGVAKKVIRDWTNRNHQKYWESLTELRQAKGLTQGPSARRTKELLKLQKPAIKVVGLFTEHCHLKDTFSNRDGQITLFVKDGKKKMDQPHTSYVIAKP
jgi:hypothetical protein